MLYFTERKPLQNAGKPQITEASASQCAVLRSAAALRKRSIAMFGHIYMKKELSYAQVKTALK